MHSSFKSFGLALKYRKFLEKNARRFGNFFVIIQHNSLIEWTYKISLYFPALIYEFTERNIVKNIF